MNYINLYFKELKFSLFYCLITILSLILIIFEYIETFISYYISLTGTNIHFIFTDIMEVFYINIKFSILFSLIFSLPSILLILFLYIKPALYSYENSLINKFYLSFNLFMLPSILYCIPNITLILINYFNQQSYNQFIYYDVELLQRFNNFYNWLFYLNLVSILLTMVSLMIIIIILPKIFLYNGLPPSTPLPASLSLEAKNVYLNKLKYKGRAPSFARLVHNNGQILKIDPFITELGGNQANIYGGDLDKRPRAKLRLRDAKGEENGWKDTKNYTQYRKYIYFLVLFIIALITPPDILSLIIIFIPFFWIYELIIYIICILKNLNIQ